MSHHVHKVTAFSLPIEDRPGALCKVTCDLKAHDTNLKALWAWAEEEGQARVMFVPERPEQISECGCETCCAAEARSVLWIEGEDKAGALDENLQKIAAQEINIQAVMAGALEGKYGAILVFADEATLEAAAKALGECCA